MNIDLEIKADIQFERRILNLSQPLEKFGQYWKDELSVKQFDRQSDADGNRWKELSYKYILWKLSKGYPLVIGKATQETFNTRGYAVQQNSIKLGYRSKQAVYFNSIRPLFNKSGQIPGAYQAALSANIAQYLNQ
jgi:hypothetical protein